MPEIETRQKVLAVLDETTLVRKTHVAVLLRRFRVACAIVNLTGKRHRQFAQTLRRVVQHLMELSASVTATMAIVERTRQHYLQVELVGRLKTAPLAQGSLEQPEPGGLTWRDLLSDLDFAYTDCRPDHVVVQLAQRIAGLPRVVETAAGPDLTQIIAAGSISEALSLAVSRYCEAVVVQSAEVREAVRHQHEKPGGAPSEFLSLLSLVVTKSRNLISILEPHGGILWANQAFLETTGYTLGEVRGRKLDELLFGPGTDREAVRAYHTALSSGQELVQEILLYHRDKNTFWVESNLIPVHSRRGELTCWLSIDVDITKWRQTEEALREAKRMAEESARMKSEFLANMSHEIRTPMNAIIGMTELVLATDLTQEQREYLLTVQSAAQSLLQLLNDVLDLSKIEAGKMTIDVVDFDLADLIRDTLKALAVRAHQKKLELTAHLPVQMQTYVRGDPVRLRQILFNLVGNAIKFTERGEVVVEVEPMHDGANLCNYHFSVRDTGIGIPREKLDQIFEAFAQVDPSMTRRFGGTGLGLAITSNLVRLMGGRIWVESQVGQGSTFHFVLPLQPAQRAPEAEAADSGSIIGKSALVVDDNATNRRILEEMLRHVQVQVTSASNAAEARAYVAQAAHEGRAFDYVIVDAMMPEEDGFQLAQALRQQWPHTIAHIVMLSSIDKPTEGARTTEGMDAFLTKPVFPRELLATLHRLASRPITPQVSAPPEQAPPAKEQSLATRPLRVLVVDDHDANRKLAVTVLQRRGHLCVEAGDGKEALALWRQQPFDVILMDVRMPGIDGLQATQIIRQEETRTGRHVPIVALTAHALKGDQEKCLAVGMDSYLSKPLRPKELVAVVEAVARGQTSAASAQETPSPSPAPLEYDFQKALESMDYDESLLIQQMQFFLKDTPELMARIRKAITQHEGKELELAAHRLKGLLARYEARQAAELAAHLEARGQQGQWEGTQMLAEQLAPLVEQLSQAIGEYLKVRNVRFHNVS
jgi:two-component system sensor histidine kinase/response regulator